MAITHLAQLHATWKRLEKQIQSKHYILDGHSLTIADVVATARYGSEPQLSLDPMVVQELQKSVDVLFEHLARGWYVYGVNTGFGGSADSRTKEVIALQASLMQHTQSGILSPHAEGTLPGHAMPPDWVRAAMVIRCNATVRGHSAVSLPVIHAVRDLLANDITPVVPLRGSVSASGDLMPLAYVAGTIEGNPDILVVRKGRVLPAPQALQEAGLAPAVLGPKEGLGLINGTSSSAGLAALVMAGTDQLAFLTQVLTAGAVEALRGSSESFHPFIAQTRPHPGQIECARNIRHFMQGSHLCRDMLQPKDRRREDLVQDRYSLRSAPQWIGPQLEDLILAQRQISTELNSSCDNPLIDSAAQDIYYGCNFQAASITSAMEKVRLSLQMFGRLLFSQATEMIDPNLSGGLPANLAADDPSLSFTMKGVDVNMAAYMAELSYLANPMSSHVQAAEMHNQSVNSMALASARMSFDALDVLIKMASCSTYVVCQALDLRVLHMTFVQKATELITKRTAHLLGEELANEELEVLQRTMHARISPLWASSGKQDLAVRCELLVVSLLPSVVAQMQGNSTVASIHEWRSRVTQALQDLWTPTFNAFCSEPRTAEFLGKGSRALYEFVRGTLGVPFHRGLVEHPTRDSDTLEGRQKRTIGGWVSLIHDAINRGDLCRVLIPKVAEGLDDVGGDINGRGQ